MKRVYTDMVADLFHIGHLNLIKRAKEHGDYLIVGVHADSSVIEYKTAPIIDECSRYEIIRSCKYVDEVIEAAPLIMTEEFLNIHKIDCVIRGDDITEELLKQQADPIRLGIMKYISRTPGVSTSSIISRIINS